MCGIAGYVGDPDRRRAEEIVRTMQASLARRGPDGEGFKQWPLASLGHRRLSIFDLSDAGRQPMTTTDEEIGVVFNGAIYNFLEIRSELEQAGARFRSRTDTEVLLHGYRQWGLDGLLHRMRGMFAIGLWDEREQALFLIRDRLGVKPLYYCSKGETLAFASTAEALRTAGFGESLNQAALLEYLEFGFITDRYSIYEGVFKVPPAGIVEWRDGRILQRTYWKPCEPAAKSARKFAEVVDEAEQRLLEAVRLRLEADVPVGALLSGGVDSSLVCWAISKLQGNLRAFTVGTPGDQDETVDARLTAQQLGLPHEVIPIAEPAPSSGIPGEMRELSSAYGEPFACYSALGMLRVAQAVKPFATVLLTGDGGDDAFLGYPEHNHFWLAERVARKLPTAAAEWWAGVAGVLSKDRAFTRRARHFFDYATGGLGAVARARDGLPGYGQMLRPALAAAELPQRAIPASLHSARNLTAEFLAYDRRTRFTGEYLTKVDGGAMYWAIEARSPFLDQELWNFAASLPVGLRLHRGVLKAVLRAIALRRLGPRVAHGKKRGFYVPATRWLTTKWKRVFEEALESSHLERHGIIRPEKVRQELQSRADSGRAASLQLWYLFVLEVWLQSRASEARA